MWYIQMHYTLHVYEKVLFLMLISQTVVCHLTDPVVHLWVLTKTVNAMI